MQRYRVHAIFALNVTFALITIMLLALDVVEIEAALKRGKMLPLNVSTTTALR